MKETGQAPLPEDKMKDYRDSGICFSVVERRFDEAKRLAWSDPMLQMEFSLDTINER